MRKVLLITITIITITMTISAQVTFQKVYGGSSSGNGPGNGGYSIIQTEDSNYILTGYWNYTISIIKVDANGNLLWNKYYHNNYSEGYSLIQTFDKNFVATGSLYTTIPTPTRNTSLIKFNSNGDSLWVKQYYEGGSHTCLGYDVKQTTDSGFIIAGQLSGQSQIYKANSKGDSLWSKTIGAYPSGFRSLALTNKGYAFLGYNVSPDSNNKDIYLLQTNTNGDSLLAKSYGGSNDDIGMCIKNTKDNGFIITGATLSFGNGGYDVYLVKIDTNGTVLWSKTFGGLDDDWGDYVSVTTDSGYIVSGSTRSFSNGGYDVYLIKTDKDGNEQWSKTYGGVDDDIGYCVKQTFDGGFIICGFRGNYIYVIKTDENGVVTGENEIALPLTNEMEIFPNPLTSSSTLRFNSLLKDAEVIISNMLGKEVMRQKLNGNQMEIERESLQSGVYIVRVNDKERQYIKKIVVE